MKIPPLRPPPPCTMKPCGVEYGRPCAHDVPPAPQPERAGLWPEGVHRAFVAGAKWWQFQKNGSTAFPSEVDEMEAEALRRYGDFDAPDAQPERGEKITLHQDDCGVWFECSETAKTHPSHCYGDDWPHRTATFDAAPQAEDPFEKIKPTAETLNEMVGSPTRDEGPGGRCAFAVGEGNFCGKPRDHSFHLNSERRYWHAFVPPVSPASSPAAEERCGHVDEIECEIKHPFQPPASEPTTPPRQLDANLGYYAPLYGPEDPPAATPEPRRWTLHQSSPGSVELHNAKSCLDHWGHTNCRIVTVIEESAVAAKITEIEHRIEWARNDVHYRAPELITVDYVRAILNHIQKALLGLPEAKP